MVISRMVSPHATHRGKAAGSGGLSIGAGVLQPGRGRRLSTSDHIPGVIAYGLAIAPLASGHEINVASVRSYSFWNTRASSMGGNVWSHSPGLTGLRECVSFSAMGPRAKQPVVICPRCRRRMATKEHKPFGPKQRKAIKFSDSLVEVAYVCESCGTEIKRTIREK
jgi:DNA-directed RNA polymerase subunit RPC12/RpoP